MTPSWLERIRANKNTVVWVTAIALFNDLLIYGIVVPILPDYATELGASQMEVSLLFGSYSVGLLVATPFFGIFSDRFGRRRPMLLALAMLALSTVCFAIGRHYYVLVLARFVQGASAAGSWVCGMALLYDSFPPAEMGAKLGLVSVVHGVGGDQ